MRTAHWVWVLTCAVGCAANEPAKELDGEVLPDGYLRYTGAPVTLAPGETKQVVQWVSSPLDHDIDLIDVRGSQGPGGHHAVLFASPDVEPVGTTRDWQPADQITARFLGGVGGEGVSGGSKLPPGAVFRVPAGSGFYIQSHYLNPTDEAITTSSTLEIAVSDPDPEKVVLSMFVNSTLAINVTDGRSEQTVTCDIQEDTALVMYVNHEHETGTGVTTMLRSGDAMQTVKTDPAWDPEWATHPNFQVTALDQPIVLHKGDQLVTTCGWDNHSGKTLGFPDEMCAFLTFYRGTADRACANNKWVTL